MPSLLITNIKSLIQTHDQNPEIRKGRNISELNLLNNAFLLIENGIIHSFGQMNECPERAHKVIDATDKLVFPSWCDSHTHLVYAGTRETEFVDRIKGLSYEQIAAKGGGILNSAKRLNETSEEVLLEESLNRANEIIKTGTGAVEIKSGYALTVEGELKMLRVARKLKELTPLTIKTTFLGAHAIPAIYKSKRSEYIQLIIEKMLPKVAEENLADYCDVFCETNYFTPDETDQILKAAIKFGLKPKIHVNQFTSIGGVKVGVENKAVSVDHLEILTEEDIAYLKNSTTIPTVLPSCSFFINIPFADGRKLIDNGLPLTLATDYNPGSTPSGNIPFVLSLACIKMKLTPEEAINAVTINGSYAMEVNNELGSITPGKKANIFITKKISSYNYLPYSFGSNLIDTVFLNGQVI